MSGPQFKKGDLLARLDPQHYRQDVEVAKSEVAAARGRGDAEPRRRNIGSESCIKNGHTTQVEYDQARQTFKTAQAQPDAAQASRSQATTISATPS